MIKTIGSFSLILSVVLMASTSGKPAKASTWHSDKGVHGYYCPGGGKRVILRIARRETAADNVRNARARARSGMPARAISKDSAGPLLTIRRLVAPA
jgi:hypothetical protein